MLPQKLYELLPYLYILIGITSAVLIDSTIVLLSSLLLIAAGVVVLIMRRSYRRHMMSDEGSFEAIGEPIVENVDDGFVLRSGTDRRSQLVDEWPTYDDSGSKIFSDRRICERRMSVS